MGTMTKTEQIEKVLEWVGLPVPQPDPLIVSYWDTDGWWRALEAWRLRVPDDRWYNVYSPHPTRPGWVVQLVGAASPHGAGNTPSTAALAALTEAIEHEG